MADEKIAPTPWQGHASTPSALRNGSKKPQSRQLLSCTKCRERKVKCDRTKPCSACCARGLPKECEFVVGDGDDYSPIQQSYEIRKLRAENQKLKRRLVAARLSNSSDDDDDDDGDGGAQGGSKPTSARAAAARRRRFKTGDRIDNLYFGTPGLASIVHDFANLHQGSHSLSHVMPRAREMYASEEWAVRYPFPILSRWEGEGASSALLHCLPEREELFTALDSFQRRIQSYSFPHSPSEVTRKEVERFLTDAEVNTERFPDMLALIFAALAMGLQRGVYDQSGGNWVPGAMAKTTQQADVYVAASMQALRMASFMNQPTMLGIQTLAILGLYLTNTGRFLDAWALFGVTIRVAHSLGLHRNPTFLNPAPPLHERMTRQALWWWMLHMDQNYSVALGRPLGISGFGDCPPPEPLMSDPTILRLSEFSNYFTILARKILGSDDLMNIAKIDEFTDKLIGLWDTMPETLQWNESWSRTETRLPEWPLDEISARIYIEIQSFLILLNRQRVERTQNADSPVGSTVLPRPPSATAWTHVSPEQTDLQLSHPAVLRGRALVINSSVSLLQVFLFFRHRNPSALTCWTIGQHAFNACMILILEEWETENTHNRWLVDQAYLVFVELQRNGVHKLANLAVQRISDGLIQLGSLKGRRESQAHMSRGPSSQPPYTPDEKVETPPMTRLSSNTVMGSTGMFLLEDPGLQSFTSQAFEPLQWRITGEPHHSSMNNPPTMSVSGITPASFPVVSPLTPIHVPVARSPYTVGLQPRVPNVPHRPPDPHLEQQRTHAGEACTQPRHEFTNTMSAAAHYASPHTGAEQTPPIKHQEGLQAEQSFPYFRTLHGSLPRQRGGRKGNSSGTSGRPQGVHKTDWPPASRRPVKRQS